MTNRIQMTRSQRRPLLLVGIWEFIRHSSFVIWISSELVFLISISVGSAEGFAILKPDAFGHHIERFNGMEAENVTNFVSNTRSFAWLHENIPFFECPDRDFEEIYYFRWWSFRKHLVQTTNG